MGEKNSSTWYAKGRGVKSKINNVGEMVRAFRLSKGMTQESLSTAIRGRESKSSHIHRYETRKRLPCIKYIYALSEVLGIDREILFRMVLKEHYDNFITMHHELFLKTMLQKSPMGKTSNLQYYFCKGRNLKHNFHEFSNIMKAAYYKKNMPYKRISDAIVAQKGEDHRRSASHLHSVINGDRVPGLMVVIDLCEFFGLKTFETYKIMVEEKGLAHAKNMVYQWELYKEMRKNEEYNFGN